MILLFSLYNMKEFSFNNSAIIDDINGIFKKECFNKILTNNVEFYKKVKGVCVDLYDNTTGNFSRDYTDNYEHYIPLLRNLND